ncbi:uncharacterized protein EDB91DRAFT_1256390 [Suillus paluster]|uniref:uncharacterized protein n=1 Tax=Suillus paluster TaxID=48578 RepID=UPI001B8636E6|nr:uncharacterized protein EDB91DRAFT_1256390 [Suillus paluster]KAG1721773.1 hypothetical protein EDB91DRAFT_1256390 [Suillus paluster]
MAISNTSPAPNNGLDAFLDASHDAELPVTLGHITIASSAPDAGSGAFLATSCDTPGHVPRQEPRPTVDWNARLLQGFDASFAAHLQQCYRQPVNMLAPPPTSTTPPVPAASELSAPAVTDWSAELHRRWSESHMTRLERRQVNNPYAKVATRREDRNAMDQQLHDLQRSKSDDRDVDTFCSQLEEALKCRKRRKVVDAWRKHIFEQKKGKSREERRHLDELCRRALHLAGSLLNSFLC